MERGGEVEGGEDVCGFAFGWCGGDGLMAINVDRDVRERP